MIDAWMMMKGGGVWPAHAGMTLPPPLFQKAAYCLLPQKRFLMTQANILSIQRRLYGLYVCKSSLDYYCTTHCCHTPKNHATLTLSYTSLCNGKVCVILTRICLVTTGA